MIDEEPKRLAEIERQEKLKKQKEEAIKLGFLIIILSFSV
jgi:hypothetical protein